MKKIIAVAVLMAVLASCKSKQAVVAVQNADEAKTVREIVKGIIKIHVSLKPCILMQKQNMKMVTIRIM